MSLTRPILRRLTGVPLFTAAGLCVLPLAATAGPQDGEKPAAVTKVAETVEVPAGDLTLTVPKTWTKEQPSSRMRLAQFTVPAADGVTEPTELVVFGGFGGTDEANIARWVAQFQPAGREAKAVRGTGREGVYTLVDVTGTFNKSVGPPMMGKTEPLPNARMLAAIVAVPGEGNYFLKMAGPAETVAAQADAFRASFGAADPGQEKPFDLGG